MTAATVRAVVLAAALLVLAGLGLFVLGVTTAENAWYWTCVAACGLAAALLVVARLRTPADDAVPAPPAPEQEPTRSGRGSARPAAPEPARPAAGGSTSAEDADEAAADRAGDPAGPGARPRPRPAGDPAAPEAPARAHGRFRGRAAGAGPAEPPEEDEEVTDLLLVVDLDDEVLVVDEHPRYHLADCSSLAGGQTVRLPVREARAEGFTPCARCGPDAHLAHRERGRRAARRD
ncbi:hypothetical protein [Geodermatophilus sp. SYSU D00700]